MQENHIAAKVWQEKVLTLLKRSIKRMGQINDELNSLFSKYPEDTFTPDGILEKDPSWRGDNGEAINSEQSWMEADKRIMIILKDQPYSSFDVRKWLVGNKEKAIDNRNLRGTKSGAESKRRTQFIPKLGRLIWGLRYSDRGNILTYEDCDNNFSDVVKCFNTQPFAFIESKKQCGISYLKNNELIANLDSPDNPLYREIDILQPNMIVCTNPEIYNRVINYFESKNYELKKLPEANHNSLRFLPNPGILIFCSYHPSAFLQSRKVFFDSVMEHYRAFLRSDYSKDFKFSKFKMNQF